MTSASEADGEVHWIKHKGKPARHGFKAHVGSDADRALVDEIAVTDAKANDGKAGPAALPDPPGGAYWGRSFLEPVRTRGGVLRIVVTGMSGCDKAETLAHLHARTNPSIRSGGGLKGSLELETRPWPAAHAVARTG